VREHLLSRLQTSLQIEQRAELAAYATVLALPVERMLLAWANKHLEHASSTHSLVDLNTDLGDSAVYLDILQSVAPRELEQQDNTEGATPLQHAQSIFKVFEMLQCPRLLQMEGYIPDTATTDKGAKAGQDRGPPKVSYVVCCLLPGACCLLPAACCLTYNPHNHHQHYHFYSIPPLPCQGHGERRFACV
jgi:hypothetical protein